MTSSCAGFTCTCRASASRKPTASRACSTVISGLTLAKRNASGAFSRTTAKECASAGSFNAGDAEPVAIATPVAAAARARSALISAVFSDPPVIALM